MTIAEDFKKPINVIFLLLAIAGIILSLIFYYNGKKTKSLSYHIDDLSLIFDSKNSSPAIKVIETDSISINDNVYLLTGVIWNSGNTPISIEDVRQALSLNLESAKKILDYKIIKQTDPSIAQFKLLKQSNSRLALSWKYFDPGYAFKFQIIYTGNDAPQFELRGKILDIPKFDKIDSVKKAEIETTWFLLFSTISISVLSTVSLIAKIKNKRRFSFFDVIFYIIMPCALIINILIKFFYHVNTIPLY